MMNVNYLKNSQIVFFEEKFLGLFYFNKMGTYKEDPDDLISDNFNITFNLNNITFKEHTIIIDGRVEDKNLKFILTTVFEFIECYLTINNLTFEFSEYPPISILLI